MDVPEKVEALKTWLSDRMGGEVDTLVIEFKTQTYGFRVRVPGVQPSPVVWVTEAAFDDHAVEDIQNGLERRQVPEMLGSDPAQHLLYTTMGEVKKY